MLPDGEFIRFKSRADAIATVPVLHEGWVQMEREDWEGTVRSLSERDKDMLLSVLMQAYHELFIMHDG